MRMVWEVRVRCRVITIALELRWLGGAWRVLKVRQEAPRGTRGPQEAPAAKASLLENPILGCHCRCASRRLHLPSFTTSSCDHSSPCRWPLGSGSGTGWIILLQFSLCSCRFPLPGFNPLPRPGTDWNIKLRSTRTIIYDTPPIWTLIWSPSINQPPWLTFPLPGSIWAIYHATVRSPESVLLCSSFGLAGSCCTLGGSSTHDPWTRFLLYSPWKCAGH